MDSELTSLLKSIKISAGIDVDAFSKSGECVASSRSTGKKQPPPHGNYNEVVQILEKDITVFSFRFRQEELIAVIKGSSIVEKRYASLISALIENASYKEEPRIEEFIASVLIGECPRQRAERFLRKFSVSNNKCFVIAIAVSAERADETLEFLIEYNSNGQDTAVKIEQELIAFVRFVDDRNEVEPETEFASILAKALYEECGISIKVGIGSVVNQFIEASQSFSQGITALRMSKLYNKSSQINAYKDYVLVKMLEEIPKYKLVEYLSTLIAEPKKLFADSELIVTVEEFLNNGLNVSETSRKLFMHRNTLMYRLDKLERLTGLDVKNFSDAVTFRLITILGRLIGER